MSRVRREREEREAKGEPKPQLKPKILGKPEAPAQPFLEQPGAAQVQPEGAEHAQPLAPDLEPPQRLNAKQKEIFNKMPPELKSGVAHMFKEFQREFQTQQRNWTKAVTDAEDVHRAMKAFEDDFHELGYTRGEGLVRLMTSHRKLRSDNEKTFADEYIRIGREREVDFEALAAYATGKTKPAGSAQGDIQSHPEYLDLRARYDQLSSQVQGYSNQAAEEENRYIGNEFRTVLNEMDQQGRYLYPELHDEGFMNSFNIRTAPLVAGIRIATPHLSYGQALKKALHTMRGDLNAGAHPNPNPASPRANGNRPPISPSSLRGRGNPPALSSNGQLPEIPPEFLRTAADTMNWVRQNRRRA